MTTYTMTNTHTGAVQIFEGEIDEILELALLEEKLEEKDYRRYTKTIRGHERNENNDEDNTKRR